MPGATQAGRFQVTEARQWQRSWIRNSWRRFEGNQRQRPLSSCSSGDPLVAGLSDTTMGGIVLCHSCSYEGFYGRAKQATWLPGFTQSFLVCLRSQPLMICGQATPIQGGMASTREKTSSSAIGGCVFLHQPFQPGRPCCPNTQETSHFTCPFAESGIAPAGVGADRKDA